MRMEARTLFDVDADGGGWTRRAVSIGGTSIASNTRIDLHALLGVTEPLERMLEVSVSDDGVTTVHLIY